MTDETNDWSDSDQLNYALLIETNRLHDLAEMDLDDPEVIEAYSKVCIDLSMTLQVKRATLQNPHLH